MALPIWVVDTSALIQIKSSVRHEARKRVFDALTGLVNAQRRLFPKQVLAELKRDAEERTRDEACTWAMSVESSACLIAPGFDEVKAVLAVVPDVLDPAKESGVDEADPYVLALARTLRGEDHDARVVTQETKDLPTKLSLSTACGILGIPSLPLSGLLRAENIVTN